MYPDEYWQDGKDGRTIKRLRAELAECREKLAAARDRERDLITSMRSYRDEVHEDLARADAALEQARGERDGEWFDALTEYLGTDIGMGDVQFPISTVRGAIDAALEQAREETSHKAFCSFTEKEPRPIYLPGHDEPVDGWLIANERYEAELEQARGEAEGKICQQWKQVLTAFTEDAGAMPIAVLGTFVPEVGRIYLAQAKAALLERCARIAEDWDWRSSGDNTNTDIAEAIREGG